MKSQHACAENPNTPTPSEWHANAGHQRHPGLRPGLGKPPAMDPLVNQAGKALPSWAGFCFSVSQLGFVYSSHRAFLLNMRGAFCLPPSFLSLKSYDKKQMFVLGFQQLYSVQSPTVYIWLFFYFQIIQIPRTSIKFLIIILHVSSLPNYHCVSEIANVDWNSRSGRPQCKFLVCFSWPVFCWYIP